MTITTNKACVIQGKPFKSGSVVYDVPPIVANKLIARGYAVAGEAKKPKNGD